MKLEKIIQWLDQTLNVGAFDDVSNNGLQVSGFGASSSGRPEEADRRTITTVAFAVDASVRAVEASAEAGAQLLVVHHGISWGGGIKRVTGGVGNVVRAAIGNGVAVAAYHLPLDAHPTLGNNAQLAKMLGLRSVKPAFSYHGNVIGLVGKCPCARLRRLPDDFNLSQAAREQVLRATSAGGRRPGQSEKANDRTAAASKDLLVGICSGGAGEFAEEAKMLGCDLYLTGEASWGDVIAAENVGMKMICAGHYETEVFGVRALSKAMKKCMKVKTVDLTAQG